MADYREVILSVWVYLNTVAWLEWAKAIFDLLKGVAWPLATFLIVWIFRVQLRERIKDLVSFGPTGAVLQPPMQASQPDTAEGLSSEPPSNLSPDLGNATHPLPTVLALIEKIRQQLGDVAEEERLPKLVVALAEAQMERQFENVWGAIFGSQIVALNRLKEGGSITFEEAKNYYDTEVRPKHAGFETWDFSQWSQFLILQELVMLAGGVFSITQLGSDFLQFVRVHKKEQQKPL